MIVEDYAAAEARRIEIIEKQHIWIDIAKGFAWSSVVVTSPCDEELCPDNYTVDTKLTVMDCIFHLNDIEDWSRESIADWLDELHDQGIINIELEPWEEDTNDDSDN